MRDGVGRQLVRIKHDLVLTDHAANRGDLGNVGHGFEFVLQKPVLQRAQLRSVLRSAAVDQCILVNPTHARRVGPQRGLRGYWQARLHLVKVFQYPRSCPVQVGAVLKQYVNKRVAEKGVAAHRLGARH